jgi:hypothetical protein
MAMYLCEVKVALTTVLMYGVNCLIAIHKINGTYNSYHFNLLQQFLSILVPNRNTQFNRSI